MLEERAVKSAAVTPHGLREMILAVLQESGLTRVLDSLEHPREGNAATTGAVQPDAGSAPAAHSGSHMFMWGGKLRRVPQGFELPVGNALHAWQQYCCGDVSLGIAPLRFLETSDLSDKNAQKRLSDFHGLFNALEGELREGGHWIDMPTEQQANDMYYRETTWATLAAPAKSLHDRARRLSQLAWSTMVNSFRRSKLQQRESSAEGEE